MDNIGNIVRTSLTGLVTREEVFNKGKIWNPISEIDSQVVMLRNALPLSIGLFPGQSDISLNMVKCNQETNTFGETFGGVKTNENRCT
jgi:hypothetical protein